MKRWIYVSQIAERHVERLWNAFKEHGCDALQGDSEQLLHADGSFVTRVHVPGFPIAPALRMTTGVSAHMPDGRIVVPLQWGAETGEFAFPEFDGAIEFEPLSSSMTRVSIIGSYVPPLGPVGTALDAAVLHRAADATASTLLARLLDGLLRTWKAHDGPKQRASRTNMTVGDVMTADPFVVDAGLPVKTTALLLFHLDVSGAPVVGDAGELIGVVTERDLLEKEASQPHGLHALDDETWRRREALTAGDACSRPARTTSPNVSLHEAVSEMQRHRVGRLVVVDQAGIAGIVTRHDVLVALIRNDAEILHVAEEVLRHRAEDTVTARVDWGTVRLTGTASLRSRRDGVVAAVADIDGVLEVDADELGWEVDDVILTMPPIA